MVWDSVGVFAAGSGVWGDASDQFSWPQDMFIDETGTIYVADYYNHRIQKWLPNASTGSTVAGITGISASTSSNTTLLSWPWSIFVRSNTMYISDNLNRILIWQIGALSGTILPGSTTLGFIRKIFVDSNGNIYAISSTYAKVMMWTSSSTNYTILTHTNGTGYSSSQLINPYGFFVDTTEKILYIANTGAHTIISWPFNGTTGSIVFGWNSTFGPYDYLLYSPQDITFDKNGNLYIADTNNHRILLLCQNPPTNIARTIFIPNIGSPICIHLDSDMNLYVLGTASYVVKKFALIKHN